jgi:hypothetical protein
MPNILEVKDLSPLRTAAERILAMVGHNGVSIKALPHDKLTEIMRTYNRVL